ncbi:WD40 repeat-like protein [Rhizophagus irregularis]|nr:WD40 repeat-like protein [Rhizophagus irregularis]
MGEPSEQLKIPQRESGKEQYLNSNELEYQEKLAEACGVSLEKRILAFNLQPPSSQKDDLRQLYNQPMKLSTIQFKRRILTSPERVLDAPGLLDDYYLNLLDWSIKNMVAIGLDQCVYIWNADTGGVTNVLKEQKIRSMLGHTARVGVITWNKHIISSGCKDGNIWHHDTRVAQHKVAELIDHTSEVCGLKWNSNGDQLASGGNDNRVNIWDARASTPRLTKNNHVAAVKALAWCPWQSHILASGGGSYDRHIHFWNVSSGARVKSIDTGSQVTSIIWSKDFKELLSNHGFPNHNMTIWSYPTLVAASDENLKFWRVFQNARKNEKSKNSDKENTGSVFGGCTIR